MVFGRRAAVRINRQTAGVSRARGSMRQAGAYLRQRDYPKSFIVSGGDASARSDVMQGLFDGVMGECPIIIVHNSDAFMEVAAISSWQDSGLNSEESPLILANQDNRCFEPFMGMTDRQVLATLRRLAMELGYTVTPRFERVARAHLRILGELDLPTNLTTLSYLTSFQDMGEFHNNVLALPCGVEAAQRIWSDLGVDDEASNSQFDLFRSVVDNLSFDAEQSAWNPDETIAEISCLWALEHNATLLLSVNNDYSRMMLTYLAQELQTYTQPYLLVLDGVAVYSEAFSEFLLRPNASRALGIVSESAADFISGDIESFQRLAERSSCLLLFKHGVGSTATALSELIGRFDSAEVDITTGTNRGFLSMLPEGSHKDVHMRLENRFRVMPEDITSLGPSQAIVFDVENDEIIYYN